MKLECKICQRIFDSPGKLQLHITSKHKETKLDYYFIKYISPSENGICKFCGNPSQFRGFTNGFKINCKDPICVKKSVAPFSKEYKMKVDGLSEEEYEKWSIEDRITKKKNTEEGFKKRREGDPDFDKKNSKYCKEYWIEKGFDAVKAKELAYNETGKNREKMKKILEDSPDYMKGKSWTSKDYWINKGHSEEEAIKIISKKQNTFSLEGCIKKYGEEAGRKKWVDRQEKWNKSYRKTNYSKKSQDLFWDIMKYYGDSDIKPRFATYKNGEKDFSGINHEFILTTNNISIKPDFILENKIIEFDGVYWHDFKRRGKPENYKRESKKDAELIKNGYKILRVNELEYEKDRKNTIEKCIKFLKND
jgi:hypothetical protein